MRRERIVSRDPGIVSGALVFAGTRALPDANVAPPIPQVNEVLRTIRPGRVVHVRA